jgi:hypothetical protein
MKLLLKASGDLHLNFDKFQEQIDENTEPSRAQRFSAEDYLAGLH